MNERGGAMRLKDLTLAEQLVLGQPAPELESRPG
jgi:hypothetical protein